MELSRNEEIAALKVLKKQIDARIKDLESSLKHQLIEAYDETGIDRMVLMVGGMEVGKASVVPSKMAPQIIPGKEKEALSFLQSVGLTDVVASKNWEESFVNVGGKCVHQATGEICDAIDFGVSKAPYVRYSGFKPEQVREAFQARGIEEMDVLRLTGGNDE